MKILILLPAFSKDKNSYGKLIASAPREWNIAVPSYRDLGLQKGINFFEKNLFSFIKNFNSSEIYLLGHSLGGALAIGFTVNYQTIVKRLFLADSKGIRNSSLYGDASTFLFRNKERTFLQHIEHFIFLLKSPLFHFKSGLIAHNASLEKELKMVKTKTILFWGEKDKLTPLEDAKKMHKLIPNANLVVFENLGHDWILENPQKFWDRIS